MAHKCESCGTVVYRRLYNTDQHKHLGVECGCTRRGRQLADRTTSAFDIRFDHVRDEMGNQLCVGSIGELERAQNRLGFQSVVLNSDAQNVDDPPQQRKYDFADVHQFKFSSRERFRQKYGR